jgi:predicted nucleic acid-binding protein
MILVDTSIWVDHLRGGDATLAELLMSGQVLCHPAVTGELALGQLQDRAGVLGLLANLPQAVSATHGEVMMLIEAHSLSGLGIGYVDAHLLAAVLLTGGDASLWTRDKRLRSAAQELGCAARTGEWGLGRT